MHKTLGRVVAGCGMIGAIAGPMAGQDRAGPLLPPTELDSLMRLAGSAVAESVLRRHVETLASDAFGGRGAGYAGEWLAIDYVTHEFRALGLTPLGDTADGHRGFVQRFPLVPPYPRYPGERLTSANVLATIPGSDSALAREVVVVGAHHDGQGRIGEADPGRSLPRGGGPLRD